MDTRRTPDRPQLIVAARGLGLRYGARVAVAALDLDIAPGEIVGVLGPNGAGKTSLLRLLATSRPPSTGSLTLLGHDAARPTPALRRAIGWAGDTSIHAETLTGRENAQLLAMLAGLAPDAAASAVATLLPRWLLEHDADTPVAQWSFGMQRKLMLIEALAHGPRLLVLDEPTNGLDVAGREALRAILAERAVQGVAAVLASNDVAEMEACCTRVLFLRRGRKVLEGIPRELIARLGGEPRVVVKRQNLADVFRAATGEALVADGDAAALEVGA